MFRKIKIYYNMKKLEREMKYELLSQLYLFVAERGQYLNLLHELAKVPPEEMKDKFFDSLAELVHGENTNKS